MKQSNFNGGKWEKVKIIIAFICLAMMVWQIVAGMKMIAANNAHPSYVTDFDSIEAGKSIFGEITHVDGSIDLSRYTGVSEFDANDSNMAIDAQTDNIETDVKYYLYITNTEKLLVFRVKDNTPIGDEMYKLSKKEIESVRFRGYVRKMKDVSRSIVATYLNTNNFLRNHNIHTGTQETIMGLEVDITAADDKIPDKQIIFTFVGAVLMFLLFIVAIKKMVKDAYVSLYYRRHPELEIHKLKRSDYLFEDDGIYTGSENTDGEFFVNTEHNMRDEGKSEEQPEELMTHMVSDGELFYEGGLNEEGNFYIDSEKKTITPYGYPDDPDNLIKKY